MTATPPHPHTWHDIHYTSPLQLEAFLQQRHKELSKEAPTSINIFESAPRSLQSMVGMSVS